MWTKYYLLKNISRQISWSPNMHHLMINAFVALSCISSGFESESDLMKSYQDTVVKLEFQKILC